ncbi:MAG: NAD(P)H-dependent oxidoreductase [bacterium]|nr:NAD(P)H-dependent oxidoreductase [bacterium]
MDKILYINACVREDSRTNILAKYLLDKLDGDIEEIKLTNTNITPLTAETLKKRDEFIYKNDFTSSVFDYAKQFKKADIIVISAPYWDFSFPALLKTYFENINVLGITFEYTKEGFPKGLCNAKKLFYITTSGGPIVSDEFGYGYVKALSNTLYGIKNVEYINAQGLDIYGADIDKILKTAKEDIDKLF